MPANYSVIPNIIESAMPSFIQYESQNETLGKDAQTLFRNPPISHDALRTRSDSLYASMARMMRWAGPTDEIFTEQFPPADMPQNAILIASDGSQKNPSDGSRKNLGVDGLEWGLVNLATMIWPRQDGKFGEMEKSVETILFLENQLFKPSGPQITDAHISLLRDVRERETLAEKSENYPTNVFSISDGPGEFWGGYKADLNLKGSYLTSLKQTIIALERMRDRGVVNAGYVSGARNNLLVRLLDVVLTFDQPLVKFREVWKHRNFPGVQDWHLLGWLKPNYRTAIFRLMTQAKGAFSDQEGLGVHFFWINAGWENHPYISRVDIPAWLVPHKMLVSQLHAIILDQCRKSGRQPYPWILLRAHKEALINQNDIDMIHRMIGAEYLRYRSTLPSSSPKETLKAVVSGWQHGQ